MISYAQNFEDVMLWRALQHIAHGFYIDVGAQDPIVDSVSLAFYEQGWRGVHVEPTAHYAQLLRQHRPDEEVIQVAVGDVDGIADLYEIPETGLSTLHAEIAGGHAERGYEARKVSVASVRLDAILSRYRDREIHWLKIDVEGHEREVVSGWTSGVGRPWVVVVESTAPMTSNDTADTFEDLVLARGYQRAYFDGLNRFYVSLDHSELMHAFRAPPNVFDQFELAISASSSFAGRGRAERKARESSEQRLGEIAESQRTLHAALESEQRKVTAEAAERERLRSELDLQRERQHAFETDRAGERAAMLALLSAEHERQRNMEAERASDRVEAERIAMARIEALRAELEGKLLSSVEALGVARAAATHQAEVAAGIRQLLDASEQRVLDASARSLDVERRRAELDSQLGTAAAEVLHLRDHVRRSDERNVELESQLALAAAEALGMREQHRQSEERGASLDAQLHTANAALGVSQRDLAWVQSVYQSIERSRSWRLMAPFRSVAWALRRGRAALRRWIETVAGAPKRAARRLLRAGAEGLRRRPGLKVRVSSSLGRFPRVKERLRRIALNPDVEVPTSIVTPEPDARAVPPTGLPADPPVPQCAGTPSGKTQSSIPSAWRYGRRMNG